MEWLRKGGMPYVTTDGDTLSNDQLIQDCVQNNECIFAIEADEATEMEEATQDSTHQWIEHPKPYQCAGCGITNNRWCSH